MASPPNDGNVAAVRAVQSIPKKHLATEAGEDIDFVDMPKASRQWVIVFQYLMRAGYDTKLTGSDGLTRAMPQSKCPIPNASGSSVVDLFKRPTTYLLRLVLNDLRS
jgi:hypothetical protein